MDNTLKAEVKNKDEQTPDKVKVRTHSFNTQQSHNITDLKAIDFNSADDVRQAMKKVIAHNLATNESDSIEGTRPTLRRPTVSQDDPKEKHTKELIKRILMKPLQSKFSHTIQQEIRKDIVLRAQNRQAAGSLLTRKRRGRPPKAGPSKKKRRMSITNMYFGKLSNYVEFRHYTDSDTN